MRQPVLRQVSVLTSRDAEEAVGELFQRILGIPPSVYVEAATGLVRISTYCETARRETESYRTALRMGLADIRAAGLDTGTGRVQVRQIPRENWAESWKRHFKPLEIGRGLLIKPSWSRRRPRPYQAVVILDPGLSFGTGNHPTTLFCLEQLVRYRRPGKDQAFLDVGTGSGILAIAAAKIGYQPVQAIDFDPAAVRIARDNAIRNGVAAGIRILRGDVTRLATNSRREFDVICANLVADLLVEQRHRILNRLAPGGVLILAGILRTQFTGVRRAYELEGMRVAASDADREWKSGAFRKL